MFLQSHDLGGVVRDRAGNPVPNLEVRVSPVRLQYKGPDTILKSTTDASGNFHMGLVPAAHMIARIDSAGIYHPFDVSPSSPDTILHLTVEERVCMRGRVTTVDGEPIEGARIALPDYGSKATDNLGLFEFISYRGASGQAQIKVVEAEGFETGQVAVGQWGGGDVLFTLPRATTVTITVRDGGGSPVSDYCVWFGTPRLCSAIERHYRGKEKHPGGTYVVENVRRGDNVARIFPSSPFLRPSPPIPVAVSGAQHSVMLISLEAMQECFVQCVDAGGAPREGLTVELIDMTGDNKALGERPSTDQWSPGCFGVLRIGVANTDANGIARLYAPKDLALCILRVVSGCPVVIESPRLMPGSPLKVVVVPPGSIKGVVHRDDYSTSVGVVCVSENGDLEGAVVGNDGTFEFPSLAPGQHTLYLTLTCSDTSPRNGLMIEGSSQVVMVAPSRSTAVTMSMRNTGFSSLFGRMVGPSPLPLGTLARLRSSARQEYSEAVPITAGGKFTFDRIPPGQYRLQLIIPMTPEAPHPIPVNLPTAIDLKVGETASQEFEFIGKRLVVFLCNPDGSSFEGVCTLRQGDQFPAGISRNGVVVLDPAPVLPLYFGRGLGGMPVWSQPVTIPNDQPSWQTTVTVPERE